MPKIAIPLTDTACRKAKPTEKPYKLADGGGMYLLVEPNDRKYWRLKYRHDGKEKLLSFGVYPEVSLAEARQARETARRLLRDGTDPALARQQARRVRSSNAANTFEKVAREWHAVNLAKWTPDYGHNILHRLIQDVFPVIGHRPIADLEAPEMLEMLRKIENRGALEIARRIGQTCGQIFRYAIATGRATRNPMPDLKDALKPVVKGHFAALEIDELPEFIRALDRNDARLYPLTRLAIRLLMLTFVRTSELIEAPWSEFDLDGAMWKIPAARMKMGRDHYVPLSRQAVAVLRELKTYSGNGELVFPNQAHPGKPMSNNTILFALGRLGYKGRMTGHGFRALAMTAIKEKLGYRHEVVDRQLAHAPKNRIDAAYDRAKFLGDRVVMMQDWADYLDAFTAEKVSAGGVKKATWQAESGNA